MQQEQRDAFIDSLEEAMRAAGVEDMYSFAVTAERWVNDYVLMFFRISQSRHSIETFLEGLPDSELPFVDMAGAMFPAIPGLLTKEMPRFLAALAAAHPVSPVGRPPAVPADMRPDVIAYVRALCGQGLTRTVAKRRAAKHYCFSLRSVERVWRDQARYEPSKPQSLAAMFRVIMAG